MHYIILSSIECIPINESYWYYIIDDNIKFIIDKNNGFINATHLCKIYKKNIKCWFKKYIKINDCKDYYYKNNKIHANNLIYGIYIHKWLLLDLISWISVDLDKLYYMIQNDYYYD
ncbi:N1R/p28-like protein [Choristoneura biennis entomopoxvirus]|uniref:N1R/p28-like protein n=1 Tax=Choristoneura biennis entomopoxvirus TaxID=10288 RepID=A0A916NXY2_CBEPV|nr:N1R/p28-like protein [Choristoneura biennis entomopoxvirus]CCU55738.1 N1R/p28-like protein [Choristoneura biennis entomopoxvirus]